MESRKNHETGDPEFENNGALFEGTHQRISLGAKTTTKPSRGYICRCLGNCGKQTLERKPEDGLCPHCGAFCAPATLASWNQARQLALKQWIPIRMQTIENAIEELGLVTFPISDDLKSGLKRIARSRSDIQNRGHLFSHRHVIDRPGLANGDLKSKASLRRALTRSSSKPKFLRAPVRESPGVMGKLIEAELEFRSNRRKTRGLSMNSTKIRYVHPVLGPNFGPITVEIDGGYDTLPVELKTVETLDALERNTRKIRDMLMQLAGQALANGVDQGVLLIAERDGELITAIRIGGLRQFHCRNISQWLTELGISHQPTEMTHKEVIRNVEL